MPELFNDKLRLFIYINFVEQVLPHIMNISCREYQYTIMFTIKTDTYMFNNLLNNCQGSILSLAFDASEKVTITEVLGLSN